MLRQHFDFRSMNQAVRAETGQRSRYGRPGNALVQEEGEDRFVERSQVVLGVLIEEDGYFLRASLRQHPRSPFFGGYRFPAITTPNQTATYPNSTLPATFNNASHRPPSRTRPSVSHSKLENVVYPPKTPTTSSSRQFGFGFSRSVNIVMMNPMRNEPVMLMNTVPSGKRPPTRVIMAVPTT